ncbi:MAG: PAS domain S-box protein [Deltaproteobacteria bacterium]
MSRYVKVRSEMAVSGRDKYCDERNGMIARPLSLIKTFHPFSRLSLDGIWVVDTSGRFLEVNKAYCELIGYTRQELLTMSVKDVEANHTLPMVLDTINRIKTAGVERFESAHRRKNGAIVPVEINSTFLEMDRKQLFLTFIRDLTEHKVMAKNTAFHNALLRLSTVKTGRQEFLKANVAEILKWCACQWVGLGLVPEPGAPPQIAACAGEQNSFGNCGARIKAHPDQCLCCRLLQHKLLPEEASLLTPGGSFYCDNFPQFIKGLPARQRLGYLAGCVTKPPASLTLIPLRYQENLLGVLLLAGDQNSRLSLPAVEFLESMAPLVGEGIARHDVEAELELNLLKQGVINRLLSLALEDLPLDEILRRSLELLTDIPFIALESKGSISLVEDDPETLVMHARKGLPEPIVRICARIPFGRCLCGQAAASRQVQFSPACDELHEVEYPGRPPHGHYCFPIMHGERVLGVINLYVKAGHRYSAREEEFLTVVANTLAGIIVRREAEEARRRSDQEFMLLVGNVPAVVFKADIHGFVDFIDDKVEKMAGYPKEELEQQRFSWTDLILKEDLVQAKSIFLRALKGSNSYVRAYRIRCKGGEVIWVQERSQIVRNPRGRVAFISGVLFDISKRRQGEEALRREKETAQRYLDVAPVIFVVLDVSEKITLINKKGCEILGYPEEEIVGRNWIDNFIPKKIRGDMRVMLKRLHAGEIEATEYLENAVLTKTGEERIIAWHNTILKNETGKITGCLSSGEDITERRRAEEALRDSIARLHRTLEGTVTALSTAVETRDPYTAGHQRGVAQLAHAIAEEMGFPHERLEGMRVMGFLHDIGKIAVPAEILSKPGRLSEYELNIVKVHSQVSYDILKEVDFPWPVAQAVLQHHEKLDGSGYPYGLKGEDIIMEARILTVADVVEAMASHRPYRPTLGVDRAIEEISQNRGILYDPVVVDACLRVLNEKRLKF